MQEAIKNRKTASGFLSRECVDKRYGSSQSLKTGSVALIKGMQSASLFRSRSSV